MEKINGIVLEVRKHSDTNNIVTLYTRSRGRVAFISAAGNGRSARMRNARLQPLALIDTELSFNPNRELQRLGAINTPHSWQDIYFNPVKSTLTLFISEFLNRILRTTAPDPLMWDFIRNSILTLDESTGSLANFHIAFLVQLMSFAGIQPDLSRVSPLRSFSMEAGEYVDEYRNGMIRQPEASALPVIARINFRNMHLYRLGSQARRQIVDGIIHYYGVHFPGSDNLKSLDILREIFA